MTLSGSDLINRAWDAFEDEDFEAAEACARRALMVEPTSVEARVLIARSLVAQERYAEALPVLKDAAAAEPDAPEILAILGITLFELCEFAEAIETLRGALRAGSDEPDTHYWFGLALERTGDFVEADRAFARAHRIEPEEYPLPQRVSRAECLAAVEEARAQLPGEFDRCLENLSIRLEELPDEEILKSFDPPMDPCLLGLFVGVPIPEKTADTLLRMPDQVFIFQRNLERSCLTHEILVEEIRTTLYHEIGHYMGHDEDELDDLGIG